MRTAPRPGPNPRGLSDNDMRWLAARVLIALEDTRKFGGMSVHELKQALKSIPGSDSLTLAYAPNGNELITIAGRTVEVSPTASNAEIVLAFSSPEPVSTGNVSFVQPTAAPATPIPPVTMIAAKTNQPLTGKKPMSAPAPGSFAASIRAMMDEARAGVAQARTDGLAKVGEAVGKLNDAKTATTHVAGTMAKTIEDEAASVLSELGQISNDLGI